VLLNPQYTLSNSRNYTYSNNIKVVKHSDSGNEY
jgi:hypothetical protein